MAEVTAIYCMKNKSDRNAPDMYCKLAELLNRQAAQGGNVTILGVYEAKKAFRCENIDPYGRGIRIAAGEYFLLADGDSDDTNHWRLHRACRSEEEAHGAWPLVGWPDDGDVYRNFRKSEEGIPVENAYMKRLDIALPRIAENIRTSGEPADNYMSVYQIHEATPSEREDTWGISLYTEKDFSDNPEYGRVFKELLECRTAEDIWQVVHFESVLSYVVKLYEKGHGGRIDPHHSVVVGIIDGKTHYWKCGAWYYKDIDGRGKLHVVQDFAPMRYERKPEGLVPVWDQFN
jgi:hypothetical protein